MYAPIAGNPTVNYLKTFTQPNLAQTLLALDSGGTLWGEFAPGALTQIAANIVPGVRAHSATLFGREYIALSDGRFGADVPRQYDGTFFRSREPGWSRRGTNLGGRRAGRTAAHHCHRAHRRGVREQYLHHHADHGTRLRRGPVGDDSWRHRRQLRRRLYHHGDAVAVELHVFAERGHRHEQRRHCNPHSASDRGRAPGVGNVPDAPGLPHANRLRRFRGPRAAAAASRSAEFR